MSMRVNTNVAAMNAYRNLAANEGSLSKSLEKLSSGFRINRASDDAAGLVISEKLRAQIGGLKVATRNAQDGISVAQTAEGALGTVTNMLQRMRDLVVQASSTGSNDAKSVAAAKAEFDKLAEEIVEIGTSTEFNGKALLDGTYNGTFQVGANDGETRTLDLTTVDLDAFDVAAVWTGDAAAGWAVAATGIATIDTQLGNVSTARGTIGAAQNGLEHTIANLGVSIENLSASESRIRDTDMAQEMTSYSRSQILQQAGTAMLAQANSSSQAVLSLLRG